MTHGLPHPPSLARFGYRLITGLLALRLLIPQAVLAQAPTITALAPTRNLRNAPAAANVAVTFSQPMQNTTATQRAVRVFSQQRGGRMFGSTRGVAAVSGNTITFNPTNDFKPGETLLVTTITAATATNGTALARAHVHQFTAAVGGTGQGYFTAPASGAETTVGAAPMGVALGDVDGDGDLDALTANHAANTVSVRLNNGSGSFTAPATNAEVAVGTMARSIVLADVDGDGDLDFLSGGLTSFAVSVRLNNGSGSFTAPATNPEVAIVNGALSLAMGDVDGDGDLDLLAANYGSNSVSVRLNNGSGNFSGGSDPAVGANPLGIAVGDVDGDGDLDFVTANFIGSTVSVRLNNGSGTFTAPATNPDPSVGGNSTGIALGDVDGDGDLDLLVSNQANSTISVRLNNGSGNFTPPATNPDPSVGGSPQSVALGDVDGDGDLDCVSASLTNAVSVRLNNGSGSFTPPALGAEVAVGQSPRSVAFGDIDGDGDLDIASTNGSSASMSVRLNQVIPLPPTITSFTPTSGPIGTSVTITGTNLSNATAARVNGTAGTITANTATSLTFTVAAGSTTGAVSVTTVAGTATGSAFTVIPPPTITSFTPGSGPVGTSVTITGTNLSGATAARVNGTAGTITANTATSLTFTVAAGSTTGAVSVTTVAGTATGSTFTVTTPVTITALSPTRNLRNAVPASDVAVTFNAAMRNNVATQQSLRVFSQQRGGRMFGSTRGVASVSGNTITFNPTNDFKPGETVFATVTTAATSTGGNVMARGHVHQFTAAVGGTGRGYFAAQPTNPDVAVGTSPASVAVGDVDGDGDLDALTANYGANTVSVRLNNGSSSFTAPATNAEVPVGAAPVSVVLADVDGDGDLDLLTANFSAHTVSVRLNNGSGIFTAPATNSEVSVYYVYGINVGDLDGDGDLDLLTANYGSHSVSVRLNNGSGNFSGGSETAVGTNPEDIAVGDVDGDGDLDFVTANLAGRNVSVRLNDGSGTFTAPATNPDPSGGVNNTGIALGDVDGDGDLDMLVSDQVSSTIGVWLNNGSGNFTPPATNPNPAIGSSPQSVTLGDIDGDGDLDCVSTCGINTVSVRLNNGNGSFTPPAVGAEISVARSPSKAVLGDIDGDGDLDVLMTSAYDNSLVVRFNQVIPPPTITSFTPGSGPVGTSITITGTNLSGATAAQVNGTAGTITANTATSLTFTVAGSSTTGAVSVTTPGGTATGSTFTVISPPTITSFTPTSGPIGTSVTITGTNLSNATAARVNGTAGTITANTATSLTFMVAAGSTTGAVSVTTPDGTATGSSFTVTTPVTITALSPTRNLRNAARGSDVAVSFSQPMQNTAATQQSVRVFSQQRGGRMFGSTRGVASVSGNTITFNPTNNFRPGETVLVTTTTAATATNGTALARAHVHQFTTAVGGTGQGYFTAPASNADPAVGTNPQGVALGDVDGDGDLDLLAANYSVPMVVSVRLNNGNGSFTAPATNAEVSVTAPSAVVLADIDGDGDLDLLSGSPSSVAVSVRLNDGSGSFALPANAAVATGQGPASLAVGDVDGDGDLDLLAANSGSGVNSVSVRLNDGGGNFTAPATNPNPAVGTSPLGIDVGDVDGDGDLDMVTSSLGSTVNVLLNNGSGNFTPPATNPTPNVGSPSKGIALGDVDGDGDLDMVVTHHLGNTVSVRLNDGSGNFTAPATNPEPVVGFGPQSVKLGDVDGDGDLDFVIAGVSDNTANILLNNGSGNFAPPATNANVAVGQQPYYAVFGDVDGDGDLDVVTANNLGNSVSVRLNQVIPLPTITSFTPGSGPVGTSITITGTNLSGATAAMVNGTAGTITANTATSLTFTVAAGSTTGAVSVTTPIGTATANTFTVIPPPTITSFTPGSGPVGTNITITGTNLSGATAARVNGTPGTITANTATSLTFTVATGSTTGAVSVTTVAGTATGSTFTVILPPSITSFTPSSGPVGTSITITGTNLSGATAAMVNGTAGTITANTATSLTFTVAAGSTTGAVSVTTVAGTATGTAFTVIQPPTITSFTPGSGPVGTSITIMGTNLSGATAARVNGTAGTITANTATSLTFTVAGGSTMGAVSVTTVAGTATGSTFTVIQPPTVNMLTPFLAPEGTPITVSGTNFTGATAVAFNGVNAAFTVLSATQITATVPVGTTSGPVTVTNPAGTGTTAPAFFRLLPIYGGPAATVNTCQGTISVVSTGTGTWQYMRAWDGDGFQLVLAINDQGTALGLVNADFYLNQGALRTDRRGTEYFDRNWRLTAANAFVGHQVRVRFYARNPEFANYVAANDGDNSDVTALNQLRVLQYSGPVEDCLLANNAPGAGREIRVLTPAAVEALSGANWFALETVVADHFSEFFLQGGLEITLPVELTAFTARRQTAYTVDLAWQTASEKNNRGFIVQRSLDGRTFTAVSELIAGHGSSNTPNAYAWSDRNAPAAFAYYRLLQLDTDGAAKYSDIVVVPGLAATTTALPALVISPNPVASGLVIRITGGPASTPVTVCDATGRRVASGTTDAAGGAEVGTQGLAAGIYIVRVADGRTARLVID